MNHISLFHPKRIVDMKKDFYDLSLVYSNIGSLYQDMGSMQVALTYFQQAANIQERNSFHITLVQSIKFTPILL